MITSEDFFHELKAHQKDLKPFVIYRMPGEVQVKALLQEDKEAFKIKDLTESGFVFAPFNTKVPAYLIPFENARNFTFDFEPNLTLENEAEITASKFPDFENLEMDQKAHEMLVQNGIDAIQKGDFDKVVLARSETVQLYDSDPIRIFKKLLKAYDDAFVYVWFHPETGFWLGATPETLLKVERTRFKTMALAGTQLYRGEQQVEWGQKEIEEQAFVTDYILDSLSQLQAIENVHITDPFTARAGNLLHIRTDITGSLQSLDDLGELIRILHPTPAVCGLPKQKALSFILNNEEHPREFYSGYLGELNMKTESKRNANRRNQENQQFSAIYKRTDLFVNLRCMQLKDDNARIFVGGGVTKDSNAADEWMETVNKSQTMKTVLVK